MRPAAWDGTLARGLQHTAPLTLPPQPGLSWRLMIHPTLLYPRDDHSQSEHVGRQEAPFCR